jgi:hypothetical protein
MEKLICEHCGTKLIAALLLAKTVAGVWIYQICAVGLTLLGFVFALIV